jgi:hypothetical protein
MARSNIDFTVPFYAEDSSEAAEIYSLKEKKFTQLAGYVS